MKILSEGDAQEIAAAVAEAERRTGGEIATAIIPESEDYGFREVVVAVGIGLVAFVIFSQFTSAIENLLTRLFWNYEAWMAPTAIGAAALTIGVAAYLLLQIPVLDRLILSRTGMAEAVARRGRRHFMESGVYDTADRTGVLIFVSLLERRVELIADRGIAQVVPRERWNSVVSLLTEGIAQGRLKVSLITAIRSVGEILAENVPPREKDTNELRNRPVILERGS